VTLGPDAGRPEEAPESGDAAERAESAALERRRRRQRLAEVFGDVLPDGTGDERGGWGEPEERGDDGDAWLRNQVPPHHGE
jgi:hypothetical protein